MALICVNVFFPEKPFNSIDFVNCVLHVAESEKL